MEKIDVFYKFVNHPSVGNELLNNFLNSNLIAYKMITTAIEKDEMKEIIKHSNNIDSFKKLSELLIEQLKEINIEQYKIDICIHKLKIIINKIYYKDKEEIGERFFMTEEENKMASDQSQQKEETKEEEDKEGRKRSKNKRQPKRSSRKKPPMTEDEKKERRKEKQKERYYKEKEKMENDPTYAAYQDYRKGIFKNRSNDPEYQRKYQEEWNFHANMFRQKQSKYYDERFFGYRPPPPPPSQKQYEKPTDNEEKQEKEYQAELKEKKDLIDSDQFRCVEPYKKGDDNKKNRLKSCKRSGNYKKGYPTFFNTLQQCVEYCNVE
jgi:hypothetical protein